MKVLYTFSFIWIIACSIHEGFAQWQFPKMEYLGPIDGLHNQVYSLSQDSTGFLYFATTSGLYRYDGHTFEFYGHDLKDEHSIGTGDVYEVLCDKSGLIWLTLRHGGLNCFDPGTEKFYHYPSPSLPFRSVPTCIAMLEDSNDILWVGATHFRLLAFDRKLKKYQSYSPEWIDTLNGSGRLNIRSIYQDRLNKDILWLSVLDFYAPDGPLTALGIVSFHKKSGKFQPHPWYGEIEFQDKDGVLWGKMRENAITRFDPSTGAFDTIHYDHLLTDTNAIVHSNDIQRYGNKLVISTRSFLISYDEASRSFEIIRTTQHENESFICLDTDREGNLWVGTNQGAYMLNPDAQHLRFFSLSKFGYNARIFPGRLAFDRIKNLVYLSTTGDPFAKRIYRINTDETKTDDLPFFTMNFNVHGITVDSKNRLWLAGGGAFHELDEVKGNIIRSLRPGKNKDLPWVWNLKSTDDGWIGAVGMSSFTWFHQNDEMIRQVNMSEFPGSDYAKSNDNDFDGFTFGKNNRAYLFSNEIFTVDLLSGKVTALKYDQNHNPYFLHVQYVGEDEKGFIWISTPEIIGRFQLIQDSLILKDAFTLNDGLVNPTAAELHPDGFGRIWAFTNSGINAIDPVTREVRFFGTKEGLPYPGTDPRQVITLSDNRIATVCSNGLIVFNADDLWHSATPTNESVVIKHIRIGGQQLTSDQAINNLTELQLSPGQNLVDIEFQGLSYPDDYRLEYSYRISGLDENWISIGQNKLITLPALSPGQYTFEVKTGKPESNAPVKSLSIFVGTPFYQQGWFILLIGLLMAGSVYVWIRWRINRVKKSEAAKTEINKKMAELELTSLRSQMNPHFMFNSLNSIKNYILQAKPELAAEYLSNFAHLIRMILHHSREKSISLQDEIETLMLYVELEQLRFEDGFEFSCIVDDGIRLDKIKIPPMLLQPFVENAIWHGLMHKKEKGQLTLHFKEENHMIHCIMDDDGVGRSASQKMKSLSAVKYKSMGMGITHDRIEIMNKLDALGITSEVLDKKDEFDQAIGTRVIICIPSQNGVI